MYQNILRLDIPMHKCLFIEHLVPFTKLFQEKPYLFLCDVVLAIEHVLIQVSAIAKLHDQVEIPLTGDLYFFVVDKIGMRWEFLQNLQLSLIHSACFLLSNRDNLADEILLEVIQIVSLNNGSRCSSTRYDMLNGIRRALQSLNIDMLLHLMVML